MKSIKLIGLSLLAIFALGAFAAMSASAEEGFLLAGGGGPGTGNVLGKTSTLQTGKQIITCKELDSSKIEFLKTEPDRHAEGTLHWLGCKAEGLFAFNSLGDKSEEILVPVLFLVCLDPLNEKKELVDNFGILALVEEGGVHLEVPAVGSLIEVKGAMLGAVLTTGKAKLWSVEFLGSKGKQTVTDCKNGATLVEHNLLSSTNHGAFEALSVNIEGGLVQFSSEVELMDS